MSVPCIVSLFLAALYSPAYLQCSEGVQWVVLKNHIEVSEQQVQLFVRTLGPNARPLQLPSGRLIEEQ